MGMAMDTENYLTTRQAAELSGLSVSYLNKLRCYGGGCPYLKIGRKCIYRRDQFEAWLAQHQYTSTSEYPASQQ
jgi:Helix-turn-helix domain